MVAPAIAAAGIEAAGSLISSGLSLFGGHQSAYQQYKYQRKLQEASADLNYNYSKKLSKWQQKYSPSYTRAGLEKAGYNPLLALGTSIGGAGTSFTGTGNAVAPDYSEGVSSALDFMNYRLTKEKTKAEVANINQNTKVQELQGEEVAEDVFAKTIRNQLANEFTQAELLNMTLTNRMVLAQAMGQETINKYLPDKLKAEIYNYISTGSSSLTSAAAQYKNANVNEKYYNAGLPGIQANNAKAQWEADNPVMSRILPTIAPSLSGMATGLGGAFIMRKPGAAPARNYKTTVPYNVNTRYPGY